MNLEVLYKQFSGNDSFETPEDRKSVYLESLEKLYPGKFYNAASYIYADEGFYTNVPVTGEMYIVTNGYSDGLIALFYPGAMERLAVKLKGSYYISIEEDEALVIPEICKPYSDCQLYFYNAETGIFSLAQGN